MAFKVSSKPSHSVIKGWAYQPSHGDSLELVLRMVPGEHCEPWPEAMSWLGLDVPAGCGGCVPALP